MLRTCMRAISLPLGLVVYLLLNPAALGQSRLDKAFGAEAAKEIQTDDPEYAETADQMRTALRKALDDTPPPAAPTDDGKALATLTGAVDNAFNKVLSGRPANPAMRAAWRRAYKQLEKGL